MNTPKIGTLRFKKFEENVIIDSNFDIDDLYRILDTDKDALSFSVDGDHGRCILFITGTVKVSRNEEILGTTYNALAKNPYKHKTKVTWNLSSGGYLLTKKAAEEAAELQNKKDRSILEKLKKG